MLVPVWILSTPGDLLTQLAELAVGDQQSSQGPETFEGLVAMALRSVLVNGRIRRANRIGVEVLRLPDEVLQQVALVLGQKQVLGLFDDISNISDELPALSRELV